MSCGLHGGNGFTVRLPLLFDLMADCQPYTLLEDPDPEDVAANRDRKAPWIRVNPLDVVQQESANVLLLLQPRRLHKRKHPSSFTPALEEDLAESTDLGDKLLDDQLLDDAQDAALVRMAHCDVAQNVGLLKRLRRPAHGNGLYSSATATAGSAIDGIGSKMDVDAEHLDDGGSSDDEDDAPFPEAYTSGPAAVPLNPELLREPQMRAILRKAVSLHLLQLGFELSDEQALDVLSDVTESYVTNLGRALQSHQERLLAEPSGPAAVKALDTTPRDTSLHVAHLFATSITPCVPEDEDCTDVDPARPGALSLPSKVIRNRLSRAIRGSLQHVGVSSIQELRNFRAAVHDVRQSLEEARPPVDSS